ncbi:MAG: SET domain-containing protein [Deltaproteobacteria bacterium]|nr:SET domain-containing protein [Deltaproteobacteria bacterium]
MKRLVEAIFLTAWIVCSHGLGWCAGAGGDSARVIIPDKKYDALTVVKPSLIPGAGDGLFAAVKIKKDAVIGEYGGRLFTDQEYPKDNGYVAEIPECAWKEAHPYRFIDGKDLGSKVSKINFAPSKINRIETHFQNAAIKQVCQRPYVLFIAIKDIEAGAEIWTSYGPNYDYFKFMYIPKVRDYFCALIKTDCREKFVYYH